jgi:Tol biopolymer transport system component
VEKKLREFQARSSEWIAAGGDSTRIQNFAERMDERLKAQDLEGANKLLDEILAMVESTHDADATPVAPRAGAAEPRPASLRAVPVGAAIVFHKSQHIYVSKADGTDVTQITFDNPRRYEHVAVSSDRTKLAANYYAESGGESSRLVIYDLEKGTETELVPYFEMAGSGGIDWDPSGYIYFAGVEENPVARPQSPQELKANMGANDIYRIRYDGADLNRVTHTLDRGEADVSVSEDGRLITYAALDFNSMDHRTEIWVNNADGSAPHLVFRGGEVRVSSVHDPEFSSDNRRLVFSQVNPDFRNFRNDPAADTAHDLCIIEVDGSGFRRLTKPGPISMIPDWSGDRIVFTELSDRENPPYMGIAFIMSDGSGYRRIVPGGNSAKWIPEPR